MKLIPLTKGQFAQVDDGDFEWLNQWKWYAHWNKKSYYAVRAESLGTMNGKTVQRTVFMHRLILGLEHGNPLTGDHRNPKQTLNNQRLNLRRADHDEQQRNKGMYASNTSGLKGVSKWADRKGYRADISINGKHKYLGTRATPEEAHALWWAAAQQDHGDFARAA